MTCANNIKNQVLAIQNFHSAMNRFPAGRQIYSPSIEYAWSFESLPYLEQGALFNRFDRTKGLGKRGKHGFTGSVEFDTSGDPIKQPASSHLLKLANALTDRARRQRQLIGGSLHLSGARHGDERLQQREASDHDASLAQLNLPTKSIACRSDTRT